MSIIAVSPTALVAIKVIFNNHRCTGKAHQGGENNGRGKTKLHDLASAFCENGGNEGFVKVNPRERRTKTLRFLFGCQVIGFFALLLCYDLGRVIKPNRILSVSLLSIVWLTNIKKGTYRHV